MTNTRQSRRRARVMADGGSQLALLINREATEAMQVIQSHTGQTQAHVVEMLLIEAASTMRPRR